MKNSLRALLGLSALALILTAAPVLAAEVDVDSENHKTGADSENRNIVNHTNGTRNDGIEITNTADVENEADVTADTGDNDQRRNTGIKGAGDPDTGDIDASADWENVVNSGSSLCDCILGGDWDIEVDFLNDTTGFNSDNVNRLDVDNSGDVSLVNVADIMNSLTVDADTGDNDQSRNTTVGEIQTGDIDIDSMIVNEANSSDSNGSAASESSVDFDGENKLTGANSNNRNVVNIDNSGSTTVTNTATINNTVDVTADTGDNDQRRNTTAGDITTGDIDVDSDITNVVNSSNECCLVGGHSTDVEVDAKNDTTGANSENHNTVNIDNGGDTSVTNTAEVTNTMNVTADTGNNNQTENTLAGEIETGNVDINLEVSNHVN